MQPITNNTQVILETIPTKQQPVRNNHSKLTNAILTTTAFLSERSIYKFTNIISSKQFISFCQQQNQQQALQQVTNIMSNHSYSICEKWIFSSIYHDYLYNHITPLVFAINNGNFALASQIISIMDEKYQQHTQDQSLAWLEACLADNNKGPQGKLARQIYRAIIPLYTLHGGNFQNLIPYLIQNKDSESIAKTYNTVQYVIEQKSEQALKQLLNICNTEEKLYSSILRYREELTSVALASNNINIIKQVLKFIICSCNKKTYLLTSIIHPVMANNNYITMKILITMMQENDISISIFNEPIIFTSFFNQYFLQYNEVKQSLLDYSLAHNYNNVALAIITSGIQLDNNKIALCYRDIDIEAAESIISTVPSGYSLPSLFWVLYNPKNKKLTTENFNMFDILRTLSSQYSIEYVLASFKRMEVDLSDTEQKIITQKFCNLPSLSKQASVNYAINILAKTGAYFNLETFKKNIAEYFSKTALEQINTIEDLFSIYC